MRRKRILIGIGSATIATAGSLLLLAPPSTVEILGDRVSRATVIQTILTGVALLAAIFAIYLSLGAAPHIRVRITVDAGMMRIHHIITITAVEDAIVGLRLELRLVPAAAPQRLSYQLLDRDAEIHSWTAATSVSLEDPEQRIVLGWDLMKARLEPLEESEQIYFALAAHGVFDPPLKPGDAKVVAIRWWSSRTGPTRLDIPLPLDVGVHEFDSRGA